jgi:hypothetical protein
MSGNPTYQELQDLVWNRFTEFVSLLFESLGRSQRGANGIDRARVGLVTERLLVLVAVPILVQSPLSLSPFS